MHRRWLNVDSINMNWQILFALGNMWAKRAPKLRCFATFKFLVPVEWGSLNISSEAAITPIRTNHIFPSSIDCKHIILLLLHLSNSIVYNNWTRCRNNNAKSNKSSKLQTYLQRQEQRILVASKPSNNSNIPLMAGNKRILYGLWYLNHS